jgi:hypothetical protein
MARAFETLGREEELTVLVSKDEGEVEMVIY